MLYDNVQYWEKLSLSKERSVADPWHFGVDPDPGSTDPCLWPMDSDPDPAFFVIDLQDANKKQFFYKIFCLLLFECTFT